MIGQEYHKIQTVYLRDPATNMRTLLEGKWALPEFEYLALNRWDFTEKIDGTNVRVVWDGNAVAFGGRTDDAQMPTFLLQRLNTLFTPDTLRAAFTDVTQVTLYGEGFGARIQKGGGNYNPKGVDFILFDVLIGDLFLERPNVEDIAAKLGISAVPEVGTGTLKDAVEMVRQGFQSTFGPFPAEGLVMRPLVEMRNRRGHRIISKIKNRDFFANLTAVECPDKDCLFCEPLAVALHEYTAEYRDLWAQRSDDADHAESQLAKVRKMAIKPRQVGLLIMMGCLLCDCVWRGDEAESHTHDCPAMSAK